MTTRSQDNIAAYGALRREQIEVFGDHGDFGKQRLINPHIFRLVGDVAGQRVLDGGAGTGYLSRMLAQRGAHVTAVEPAPAFFDYAIERERQEPLGITYRQADLSTMRSEAQFDVVISSMVLMDIPDWEPALACCIDSLVPGGLLILGLTHPCFEDSEQGFVTHGHVVVKEYLNEYVIPQSIGYRVHRPLSRYVNAALRRGCHLVEMIEPQLPASFGAVKDVVVPSYVILTFRSGLPA